MGNRQGFTLLETLVAVAIFAVGALGALSLVLDITTLNANSGQMQEADQIANWFLEQVEVRAATDPSIINDAPSPDVWVGGAYGGGAIVMNKASVSTVGIPDISYVGATSSGPSGTSSGRPSVRYQVQWVSDLNTGAGSSVRHWRLRVAWPRNRDARVRRETEGTPPFVNCFPTAGNPDRANCVVVEYHTYRKVT